MMHPSICLFGKYDLLRRYNVLYSKNFNPGKQKYLPFAMNVTQKELPHVLMKLSRVFYARITSLAVAVNGVCAGENEALKEDDEIVLIPPVSGG